MFEKLRKFLNNIQNSDEAVKKRWLLGASAVSMVFIITLWIVYIGFIIKPMDSEGSPKSTGEFWPIFKNGLFIAGAELGGFASRLWNLTVVQIKNIVSVIMRERTITFELR